MEPEITVVHQRERTLRDMKCKEWVNVGILFFLDIVSFMDMYTLAAVLQSVQVYFKIDNEKGGLLRTVYICSIMTGSPIFGMLGDRYSRKWIITVGVCVWTSSVLISTFLTNYWYFLLTRALLGLGESAFCTLAPTIIADMFTGNLRTKILAFYYFSSLLGTGLGYIGAAAVANFMNNQWQWALRVTGPQALISIFLVLFVLDEPRREKRKEDNLEETSWKKDVLYLLGNKSYVFITTGFICAVFVVGAWDWWGPKFIALGVMVQHGKTVNIDDVGYKFGAIIMIAGLTGVPSGVLITERLHRKVAKAEVYILTGAMLSTIPSSCLTVVMAKYNFHGCFAILFTLIFALSFVWAVSINIMLCVVNSRRRAIAIGLHLFATHAFGDLASPYIIGLLSDVFKRLLDSEYSDYYKEFLSLQYALYVNGLVFVIGSICAVLTTIHYERDKEEAEQINTRISKLTTL